MRKFVALTLTAMFMLLGVSTANAWVTRASSVKTATGSFGGHLSSADNTVQKALDTLDDISAGTGTITSVGDGSSAAALDGSSDGGTYIRLYDGSDHYGELQCPSVSGNVVFTIPGYTLAMPTADGSSGQILKTNADGSTSWATASGSGTVTSIKEDDTRVGDADIIEVDFGTSFEVTESPDTEINITLDLTPSSGNATLVATEDSVQVKYETTDFGETSDGLVLGSSPTIATALLMGSDPAEAGTIRMPLAGSIVFEDGTEGAITHVNDYGFSFNVDLEAADGNNAFIIRADNETTDTLALQAMDIDGSYTSLVTLTSHTTAPTLTLASTGASTYISSGSTVTIESVVFTGAAVSGVSTLGTTDDITIVAGDPDLVFTDSTHSAQGKIMMDSVDEHDGVMVLAVDDGAADDNPYIEIDGANDRIEMKLALLCDTTAEFDGIAAFDANPKIYDGSHYLTFDADGLTSAATIKFGGDTNNLLIANGTAAIDIAASATLDLDKNLTVDGQGLTLTGGGQANIVTFNEAFTIADGYAGTLDFTGSGKTLNIEGTSTVDQDLTTDAGPRFETIEIGAATDTTLARGAAGAMTVESDYIILSGDTITGDVGVTFDVDGSSAATIADSVAVASWTLTTPSVTNGITITGADAAPNAASEFLYDNVVAGLDDGAFAYYNSDGDTVYTVAAYVVVPGDAQDDYVLSYDKDSDRLYFKLDADAGGNPEYQNIADPTADGSISFGNDEEAVYTSAQAAAANDVFSFIATGAFGDISIVKIDQNTGDATDGTMLEIATDDANVDHLLLQFGASDYVTHKIIDVGSYTMDITSDGTPKFVFADEVSLTKVPAASAAMNVLTLSGTLAALDADDFTAILIDYDTTAEHLTSGEIIMLEIDAMDGDAQIDSYGIRIGNMANQAKIEQAIEIGTGWDCGIDFEDATANILHSGATSLSIISTSGTVIVESVTFTADAISGVSSLGMGGALSGVSTLGTTDDITINTATPDIILDDSGGADGKIALEATDAVDAIMTFAVDDSGGDDQAYIECDGVAEAVDILQKMTVTGISHLGDGGASHYVAVSATGAMTFVGNAELILQSSNADPTVTGEIRHDSDVTGLLTGALAWYDGDEIRYLVDLDALPTNDNYVVAYDADNDNFYMMSGAAATAWDDLTAPDANESLDHTVYYTDWDFGDTDHDMLTIWGTGAFGNYSIVRIEQKTGDATDGDVLSLQTADANVDHLVLGFGADEYVTHKIVDAGTYTMDITSNATAEFVFADETTITAVNAAASSMDALTLSGTTGNFDGADVFRGLYLNYVTGTHAGDTNYQVGIDFAALTGDADTNLYAIRIGALTGTAGSTEVEHAISIGTGWDAGINFTDDTAILNHSGATSLAITSASGTVIIDGATTFTGANVTSMGTLGVGAVTSTGLIKSNASAPALETSDTDGAAGTGLLTFASTGAYDVVGTIKVDVGGDPIAYVEIDGVSETVDVLKDLTLPDSETIYFVDADDAEVVISGTAGVLTVASLGGTQGDQQALTIDLDVTDDSIIIGATNATIVDFGSEQVAGGSFDASEGNISNVGVIQADELEPDAVANGSLIVQGGLTAGNTLKLQVYDVDGTAYVDIITITAVDDGGLTGGTMAIDTSDWNIDATGAITGVALDGDGTGNTITNVKNSAIKWADIDNLGDEGALVVADESSDASCNVLFVTAATGTLPPLAGTNLTFASNTGELEATIVSVVTALHPDSNDDADIGTTALGFNDLFLADGGKIDLGNDQDVTITHVADTGILMELDDSIAFYDAAVYIESNDDSYLDFVADGGFRFYDAAADGSPLLAIGSAAAERLEIVVTYEASGTLVESVAFTTKTADTDANDGEMLFYVDEALEFSINDTGILIADAGTIGSATATTAMTIASTGIVTFVDDILIKNAGTIGSAGDTDAIAIDSSGGVACTAATEATGITAAALETAGGLGVSLDVWIGDDVVLDSDSCVLRFGDGQDVTLTHVNDLGLQLNLALSIADDQFISYGGTLAAYDWTVIYDETTSNRLEYTHTAGADADVYWDLNDNAADSVFTIANSDGTYEANLVVDGNITSSSTGDSYLQLTNNSAGLTPSGYRLYVDNAEWYFSENGAEELILTQEDGATLTGTSWSFLGVTNMVLPSAAADASGEISMSTGNQLIWHDGTKVITVDTTPTDDNFVLKYDNASATFTLEADETGGTPAWNSVTAPTADVNLIHDINEETQFTYTGNFTTGAQFNVEQLTGDPTGGILFQVKAADTNVTLARLGDGTNYTQISQTGNLTLAGSAQITAGAIILGDTTPDTAGEIGFVTNAFKFFGANSEDLSINVGTAANTCTITSNTSVATLDIQIAKLLTDEVEIGTLLDVDEEATFDFDAADEEITITQAYDGAATINDVVTITQSGTTVTAGNLLQLTLADASVDPLNITAAVNDGNPEIRMGATDAEELHVQVSYHSGAQTLEFVEFITDSAAGNADDGKYIFDVDGTDIAIINDGGINPAAANTQTLGDADAEWGDLFLGAASVIYGGADQSEAITHVDNTGWIIGLDEQLQFGDSAVYILSDDDGYLDIEADTAIRMDGPVDMQANALDLSGNTTTLSTIAGTLSDGTASWATATQVLDGFAEVHGAAINVGLTDPADTGVLNLELASVIAWEDGTECTLTHVDNVGLALNLQFQAATLTDGTASMASGSLTAVVGVDASGTISANLFNPDGADGADIGTVDLEFSDIYLADSSIIKFGANQDVTITHDPDDGLTFAVAGQSNNEDLNLDLETTADTWTLSSSTGVTAMTLTGITTLTMAAATDPYVFLNETDGTDLYIGLNDTGNIIEFRTSATNDTLMLLGLTEAGALVFEGDTDDTFETTLAVVEPTADATITAPDYTGGLPIIIAQGYTQLVHSEASTVDITGGGVTLADGWFTEGKTLKFVVGGTLTGANDTMSVILYLEDGAVMTLTTADGAAGDWVAEFTVVAESATAQRIIGKLFAEDGVETICDYAADSTDTGADGTIPVKLQFALANATDSITSEYVQIWHWNKAD